jgi:hypothetical protein
VLAVTNHLRIGGEWCFLSFDTLTPHADAVILIHGNGQTVEEKSSSWERDAGSSLLMARLRAAGFLLAQSLATGCGGTRVRKQRC